MTKTNKTSNLIYRFLSAEYFDALYQINLEAFSDYLIPLQMTKAQFENHIAQNAVDLDRSVGAFANDKMIGFTLNGFGRWNAKKTAYDAGTGVIPDFRRKGVGREMFNFLFPKLREIGIEQMLLEVLEKNEKAIRLYENLGFKRARNLLFFEQGESLNLKRNDDIEIREIEKPDWTLLKTIWDGTTSWQFSSEAIEKKISSKMILGAFSRTEIIGYGVFYPKSGAIPQIAVAKEHRGKKIASTLLSEMKIKSPPDKKLRFNNVDDSLTNTIGFIKGMGFKPTITQFEMIKTL